MTETVDGSASSTFTYDAPGRLVAATVPGHSLAYAFAPSANCGLAPAAGKNTNRTAVADNRAAPTTSCYNRADQLTSSSDPGVGTPTYDAHGNTKTMGTQTLTYDGSDRHVATTTGTTTVSYVRDATDRIVSRTEAGTTLRYGFDGPGDASAFTTDSFGLLVQDTTMGLVGGAMVTKRSAGDVWSYPNIHGDIVATANASGVKAGGAIAYDPFGQALTPSGPTNPDGVPDNSGANFDYGWLGQNQKGLEHAPGIATIEMGARPYVPSLGRFLRVDPVQGGCENDYTYVSDPTNKVDLTGEMQSCSNAQDATGFGGAGLGTLIRQSDGKYNLQVTLFADFLAQFSAATFSTGYSVGYSVDGKTARGQFAGDATSRPAYDDIHTRQVVQGRKYRDRGFTSRKQHTIQSGAALRLQINIDYYDPVSFREFSVRGSITCKV